MDGALSQKVGTVTATHTLSPLIMYNPNGTSSTPSDEYSRSTQSAKMRFVRTSKPFNLPLCPDQLETVRDVKGD